MGRVLLARDPVLERKVAIKVLRDDLGVPPEVRSALNQRFRQEAKAAAALGHPNMVTLHDMGEDDNVGLYLVFEYLDGPTLRGKLDAGPLSKHDVARLARELGAALTHAHDAGVIHRDVKPENVMLSKTGSKLTDFGIARLPDSTLTRAGSVLGTPAYSAPESLALAEFGPRSDQFSLAATLYEALSGERAFPGDDVLAVATRVAIEPPKPLGRRELSKVEAVLGRALAKDPQKRFPTAAAFGDAFADALDTLPGLELRLSMPHSSVPHSTQRRLRRWQNVLAAVAVLVIATLALLGRHASKPAGSGVSLKSAASAFASSLRPPTRPAGKSPTPPRSTASVSPPAQSSSTSL
jgi:serine/threonine-protein kinase